MRSNLRDSGVKDVVVALRPGSASSRRPRPPASRCMTPAEAAKWADVVMVLAPDELQAELYHDDLAPNMRQGAALAFAHGLNIHFRLIEPRPDLDVFMIAPKGPGHTVRSEYLRGGGVPCLRGGRAERRRATRSRSRSPTPRAIGGGRAGIIETTLPRGMRDRPVRRAGRCCAAG